MVQFEEDLSKIYDFASCIVVPLASDYHLKVGWAREFVKWGVY